MKPIHELSGPEARALRGLLFDLDDTFLEAGRLTLEAYAALFQLRAAGLRLVLVTGRPVSLGHTLASQWPIDAAVTENGGMICVREAGHVVERPAPGIDLEGTARQLEQLRRVLAARFPNLELAGDHRGRRTDLSFDIGETATVSPELIKNVSDVVQSEGARTQRSSIHLHAYFHGFDKARGVFFLLDALYAEDPTEARFAYAYIGDSENDASCFAAFRQSIGVQNFRGRPTVLPRYRTTLPSARGFVEAAAVITALRKEDTGGASRG